MNIIMTGSTSFVGAATVRELLRRGHTVTAIVRPKSSKLDTILEGNEEALLSGRLLVTENDLSEPEKLLEKVTKPQEVFCHFGWGGSGSASRTLREIFAARRFLLCMLAHVTIRSPIPESPV